MNRNKELENFLIAVQESTKDDQERVKYAIQNKTEECMQLKNDEQKFVNCMIHLEKKTNKQYTLLEFKMKYWQYRTHECFNNNPNIEECKKDSKSLLCQIFRDFKL